MFDRCFIYFAFAVLTGIAALVVIPKNQYRRFLLYSIFLGGLGDVILAPLFSKAFVFIRYNEMGYFDIFGVFAFWTPVTWMFAFAIFFFLMPTSRALLILYLLIWTSLSYSVGLVLNAFGLFDYIGAGRYIMPLVFLLWYAFAAFVYRKFEINGEGGGLT